MKRSIPMFARERSAGYLVNYAARLFAKALYQRLDQYKVAPGQFPVLLHLWELKECTQKRLCQCIQVEQPTLVRTLDRMERDGLIVRRRNTSDRRQYRIFLTPRAKQLKPTLLECAIDVNKTALAGLNETDRNTFFGILRHIVGNLKNTHPKQRDKEGTYDK